MMIIAGLVGGLALFLYGMSVMSGGLTKLSGTTLEKILSGITQKRFIAYLFGVGVTALVQSSSTTTVMVVGFVNSGIISLSQAVNVILGANLGTTANAWLLSLNAIGSTGPAFLALFKPAVFTPFVAFIGILLYMTAKKDKRKNIGTILLGFAVLMTGMQTMSGAVAPLSSNTVFTGILTSFANPVIGFLVELRQHGGNRRADAVGLALHPRHTACMLRVDAAEVVDADRTVVVRTVLHALVVIGHPP